MTIEFQLTDINGSPLKEGSRVTAYGQDYEEISRDDSDPSCPIIEEDHSKPKPIKDVPLFQGIVVWNPEQLAMEIVIEKMMVKWETKPCRVRMGGGSYVYELVS